MLRRLAEAASSPILGEFDDKPLSQLLADARRDGYRRVIVAGGDGTLGRVVNAAIPHLADFDFALIPTGTGNDLARALGIHGVELEHAWEWAVSNTPVAIDLVKVTNGSTHYCVNAATAGFGGMVSTDVTSHDKQRWGAFAYWMTAFSRLAALEEYDIRLEFADDQIALATYGLAIANGRYVGGGFPAAPSAILNDGLLDVTTVPVLPTLELLAAGVDFTLGRHDQADGVNTYRARSARIHADPILPYSFDGEPTRAIDATFEVIPEAMNIVSGRNPEALQLEPEPQESVA